MLQQTVLKKQAAGMPGQIAKGSHSYYNSIEAFIADDISRVGYFIQTGANQQEFIMASGRPITGNIRGVLVRDELRNSDIETDFVKKGEAHTCLDVGNIWIKATGIIVVDDYVFLKTSDGSLAFGNNPTLADHTFTGFRVAVGNDTSGDGVILITTARV